METFGVRSRKALLALLAVALAVTAPSAPAQDASEPSVEETVANLAAGRVVIIVAKDAILIGTLENPIEAATRPPTPVPLTSARAGIILGPVQWISPSSQQEIARLDQDLPHVHGQQLSQGPHLAAATAGTEATDLESVGEGLLVRLNQVAGNLHGEVDLPSNEPLLELVLVDYLSGYGPEVWQLGYPMRQQEERIDYWTTSILRPSYLQLYPPEKGQPRTIVEISYPPENAPPTLLELMRQGDPRLEKVRNSDPQLARVADSLLRGESNKLLSADVTQFLRAALDAIAPPQTRETMAIIGAETGFAWILPPPAEPKPAPGTQPPAPAQPQADRPPGAPTLIHPPQ